MHPAYEGLSAMPFYDEFDLSTVDVLLISQYVHARFAIRLRHHEGRDLAHHCSRTGVEDTYNAASCIAEQWNIICIIPVRLR